MCNISRFTLKIDNYSIYLEERVLQRIGDNLNTNCRRKLAMLPYEPITVSLSSYPCKRLNRDSSRSLNTMANTTNTFELPDIFAYYYYYLLR